MIRLEFRKILLDQRGAAVILWSAFVISIPIYLVIARNVLGNPNIGSNRSLAETARVVLWLLTVVDLGYYAYWRKRNLSSGDPARRARDQTLSRLGRIQRRHRRTRRLRGVYLRHPQSCDFRNHRSSRGLWLGVGYPWPLCSRSILALGFEHRAFSVGISV